MAKVITLLNGENVTLFSNRDAIDVMERFCGHEFARHIGDTLEYHEETENRIAECITDWTAYDNNVESPYEHIDTLKEWSEDELDQAVENLDSILELLPSAEGTIDIIKMSLDKVREYITDMRADSDKLHSYIENIHNNF